MNKKEKVTKKITVRGVEVTANVWEYGYNEDDIYSYNEKLEIENDIIIFDAYKKQVGLLTSQEIIALREKYNISQATLSKILGFGIKTITRYENGTIQDKSNDLLLRLIKENDNIFELVYKMNKDKLTRKEKENYYTEW